MAKSTISFQGIDIEIRRSLRARQYRLQVKSDGQVTVVIPRLGTERFVNRFLESHTDWLKKTHSRAREKMAQHPPRGFNNGSIFYYLGEAWPLVIRPAQGRRGMVKFSGGYMVAHVPSGKTTKSVIEDFYKQKASEAIYDRLEFWNEHYGFSFNRVTFRNQKSRWGSCSAQRNLNFNWRLVMAPIEVIDYVVVHELCHLAQMNHSARFWALVAETIPDFKERKKWLKQNDFLLKW